MIEKDILHTRLETDFCRERWERRQSSAEKPPPGNFARPTRQKKHFSVRAVATGIVEEVCLPARKLDFVESARVLGAMRHPDQQHDICLRRHCECHGLLGPRLSVFLTYTPATYTLDARARLSRSNWGPRVGREHAQAMGSGLGEDGCAHRPGCR
jgi:hypothetical protein